MDSTEISVYRQQEQSAYNGLFEARWKSGAWRTQSASQPTNLQQDIAAGDRAVRLGKQAAKTTCPSCHLRSLPAPAGWAADHAEEGRGERCLRNRLK
jgi:hypothetical protein